MANRLSYELRADGVLYSLQGNISILVKRKSPSRVQVELGREDTLIPPESGDLGTPKAYRAQSCRRRTDRHLSPCRGQPEEGRPDPARVYTRGGAKQR